MATFQTALAKGIEAVDELCLAMNQPTVSSQLGQVTQLQADLTKANTTITTLQGKITAAITAAQADKDADAANVAGQAVLTALA